MKFIMILLTILAALLTSCNLFNIEDTIPTWYPSIRTYSNWEMNVFNSKYNRFVNTYNLSDERVHLDSISAHMKSFQIDKGIMLCDFATAVDSVEEFKSKIFDFYNDWWRLFSSDKFVIDSTRISIWDNGTISGAFYVKNSYDHLCKDPRGELGRLIATVDNTGRLYYLYSSLVPQLRIPDHPLISETDAIDILEGYEYTINAWLYSKTITLSREDLDKSDLTVYVQDSVQDNDESLIYRLAWRFECRDANVYVDAMTGEIIGYEVTAIFM